MTDTMKEHELNGLGIFRIPIPIPFEAAGGPVNTYIIEEEDGILIFDPGIGTESAQDALSEGFAQIGHHFEEVNRILLSHGHLDHYGSAAWIMEQAGRPIPVLIHGADMDKVLQSGTEWPALLRKNGGYLTRLGMPAHLLEETAAKIGKNAGLGRRLPAVSPLFAGEKFRCRHVTLEILHMPGHTPGLCCLYERNHRLLFSGDHLLERVSPNPTIDFRPDGAISSFKPLVNHFRSLAQVRSLPIELVLPGHAAPFSACAKVIDSLHAFYERRQARILEILKHGPLKVYEVMQELFVGGDGFELILMISETLGNLEVLEEKGKTVRDTNGEFIRFRIVDNR